MRPELRPDLCHAQSMPIDQTLTVPAVSPHFAGFAEMPPVFATAFMVGFMEWACVEALKPYLDATEDSVGSRIEVSHCAPTPVGMNVTAMVRLLDVDGRKLRFAVACRDELDVIGEGFHERVIVDRDRFMARLAAKASMVAANDRDAIGSGSQRP